MNIDKSVLERADLDRLKRELLKKRLHGKMVKNKDIYTIPRRVTTGPSPLSFAQQRLWFVEQFERESPIYTIPFGFHLKGPLNIGVFKQCLNELVRRHETLRTAFTVLDGQPVAAIISELKTDLPIHDMSSIPQNRQMLKVQQTAFQEARYFFDLSTPPLFKCILMKLAENEYVFLLIIHHIVYDGWSINILMKEFTALYRAFLTGKPSPLPEIQVQYSDFAQWQREWLHGEVLGQQLTYWKEQLAGIAPMLKLPTDYPRPIRQTFQGDTHLFPLPLSLYTRLKDFCRKERCTLFVALLTAFKVLLFRYTGQEDLALGTPAANRRCPELENLIGFFVNILVIRTKLVGTLSFLELLKRIKKTILEAQTHQDTPFDLLVEELHPERNIGYHPLYQAAFSLRNALEHTFEFPGIAVTPLHLQNGTSKLDLFLEVIEDKNGLTGILEFNTDLFKAETIVRISEHFQTLLEGIVANPERSISEISILTQAESQKILMDWNATSVNYSKKFCIHELIERQVQQTPDAVAVIFGTQQLTYQELNCRANQLAHFLKKSGIGPEKLVGICVERSLEMIIGILGILKSGGAYVPLDPEYPQNRLAFMLSDSQISVLLTQKKLLSKLPQQKPQILCLDTEWRTICQESTNNLDSPAAPKDLAYVIYTSGSTGKPKGTLILHQNVLNLIGWHQEAFQITATDQATQLAGPAFDASAWEVWPYLSAGATLHLARSEDLETPKSLQNWLVSAHITVSFLPTPLAEQMLSLKWPEHTSLRIMLTGGDRLRQYPPDSLPFKLINNYGPTENTVVTTSGVVTNCKLAERAPLIGRPIANTSIYILDTYLQPVPIGVAGELHVTGDGLARGYLNRPELTREKFIPNPFSDDPNARLYKTGDLARYLPDGNIEFLDRIDHQVKIRGFRIELGEIESVLLQHQTIREAVVIARESASGDKQLAAYVVAKQEQQISARHLRDALNIQLPDYMIPATFTFLDALPLTPNGKIDRRALPEPDAARPDLADAFVAPRTPAEEMMAKLWRFVLNIEQVGIYDNFFELGGHSLLTVQLMTTIEDTFQVKVPLWKLFETPTVAGLVAAIEAEEWTGPDQHALEEQPIDPQADALLDETIQPLGIESRASADTKAERLSSAKVCQRQIEPATSRQEGASASLIFQPGGSAPGNERSSIFLTGATGFLGAFLLYELLQQTPAVVYCLVRAANEDERQRYPIELKVCYDTQTVQEGQDQLAGYMDTLGCAEGWLIIFDRRTTVSWEEKISWQTETVKGKTIHVVGC